MGERRERHRRGVPGGGGRSAWRRSSRFCWRGAPGGGGAANGGGAMGGAPGGGGAANGGGAMGGALASRRRRGGVRQERPTECPSRYVCVMPCSPQARGREPSWVRGCGGRERAGWRRVCTRPPAWGRGGQRWWSRVTNPPMWDQCGIAPSTALDCASPLTGKAAKWASTGRTLWQQSAVHV